MAEIFKLLKTLMSFIHCSMLLSKTEQTDTDRVPPSTHTDIIAFITWDDTCAVFYSSVTLVSSLSLQEFLTSADMFQLCQLHLTHAIDFIASSKSDLLCRSLSPNFLLLFFNLRPISRPHVSFHPSYFRCFAIKDFLPPGFCGSLVKKSWPTLADSQ